MQNKGFIEELRWRNMQQDFTPGIEEHLHNNMRLGYIGFDPTAKSLGIGNFVQIMLLNFFQRAGHKPIVVMGGATGRVGDPSGKDKERELKSFEELDENIQLQEKQFRSLLNFDTGSNKAIMVNNFDFYKDMHVLDFLREVGKNATINYMLAKEAVKRRIDSGISYTEFSYQLLQAYDYYCLYKNFNCTVQMGGSDQWGNIVAGTDYIGKTIPGAKAFAITTPLLTKSDGKKFGKTEEGNIWLDANLTSPYKFYQFWLNADDTDLYKLFRYFSYKTQEEILNLEEKFATDPRELKKVLAEEITIRVHGKGLYQNVMEVSEILFNKDLTAESIRNMSSDIWKAAAREIPSYNIGKENLIQELDIVSLLTDKTAVLSSKSEARRAIQGNAISINKEKITDPNFQIHAHHFQQEQYLLIENGKKNKYLIIKN